MAPLPLQRPTVAGLLAALAVASLAACGSPSVGGAVADAPITTALDSWAWVEFSNAVCGSGQTTGLGVNRTARTTDVVIYFMGGGACWDEATCITSPQATSLDGFGVTDFNVLSLFFGGTPLDRALAGNPFKDASLVFVPYCTGDLHAGTTVNTYGSRFIHHAGAQNVEAYLRRLAATFPGARRIYITGSSAGGYGAQINFDRFAAAFPDAEVHALADSAQAVMPSTDLYATWLAAWRPAYPAGCTGCSTDLTALPAWLASTYSTSRFGLLAFEKDDTLPGYFGMTQAAFETGTLALFRDVYDPSDNARYFAQAGPDHVMLLGDLSQAVGTVTLRDWLTAWRDGTAGFVSVKP